VTLFDDDAAAAGKKGEGKRAGARAENGDAGKTLILQFDGGSRGNPGPAGIGVTVSTASGERLYELGEFLGRCTNNVAEYTGLVRGLAAAKALGATRLIVRADSELIVRQLNGQYKVKSPDLKPLYQRAVALMAEIGEVKVSHVFREGNARADALANLAMDGGRKIEPLGPAGGRGGAG
jgi:ribonuclease HI